MKRLTHGTIRTFFLIMLSVICFADYSKAQVPDKNTGDVQVPIIQNIGSRSFRCYFDNAAYDESSFKKLIAAKACEYAGAFIKPDFNKQTLIGYRVRGDCFINAAVKVFRNDEKKKYKVEITNYWGGCRASGTFEGWLTIEKIPADYDLEFHEIKSDEYGSKISLPN